VLHDDFPIRVLGNLLIGHVIPVDGIDHAFRAHIHHLVLDIYFRPGRHDADDSPGTQRVRVALIVVGRPFQLDYSLLHLLEGGVPVQEVVAATPYGPSLVAGGSGVASLAELEGRHMQTLARAMHWIAGCHDVVLLDCAAGLAPQSLITVLAAQHVVVVTNPEIAALTDAYALIKCLARQGVHPQVHLAVNRVGQSGLGRATFERLAEVSRRFAGCEIHYLGEVPEDPSVTHRRLGQPPLLCSAPECATTKAVMAMFQLLMQRVEAPAATADGVEARMLAQIRRW